MFNSKTISTQNLKGAKCYGACAHAWMKTTITWLSIIANIYAHGPLPVLKAALRCSVWWTDSPRLVMSVLWWVLWVASYWQKNIIHIPYGGMGLNLNIKIWLIYSNSIVKNGQIHSGIFCIIRASPAIMRIIKTVSIIAIMRFLKA